MVSHLIVVLICFSLLTNDMEPLFVFVLDICISSLEKCLFKSFSNLCILKFDLFVVVELQVLYIFWILDSYQIYDLQIFSLGWAVFGLSSHSPENIL